MLRLVLQLAVRSGALKSNPAVGVKVAKSRRKEMIFLEPDQIIRLAEGVSRPPQRYRRGERRQSGYPEYRLLVRTSAFTGLRAGELVALRRKAIDTKSRRIHVRESASEPHGELQIVATKTYESRSVRLFLSALGHTPTSDHGRLGHSTITVTLDTYGDLFPSLEAVLESQVEAIHCAARHSDD